MAKTTKNTTQYEAAHGKTPKGFGLWFLVLTFTDGNGAYSTEQVQVTGNLTQAIQMAWKQVKSGCAAAKVLVEVEVLS